MTTPSITTLHFPPSLPALLPGRASKHRARLRVLALSALLGLAGAGAAAAPAQAAQLNADLTVSSSELDAQIRPNEAQTSIITVGNAGPDDVAQAVEAKVEYLGPGGFAVIPTSVECSDGGLGSTMGAATCTWSEGLAAQGTRTMTVSWYAQFAGGEIQQTSTVNMPSGDTDSDGYEPSDAADYRSTEAVNPSGDLSLSGSGVPAEVHVGDEFDLVLTRSNAAGGDDDARQQRVGLSYTKGRFEMLSDVSDCLPPWFPSKTFETADCPIADSVAAGESVSRTFRLRAISKGDAQLNAFASSGWGGGSYQDTSFGNDAYQAAFTVAPERVKPEPTPEPDPVVQPDPDPVVVQPDPDPVMQSVVLRPRNGVLRVTRRGTGRIRIKCSTSASKCSRSTLVLRGKLRFIGRSRDHICAVRPLRGCRGAHRIFTRRFVVRVLLPRMRSGQRRALTITLDRKQRAQLRRAGKRGVRVVTQSGGKTTRFTIRRGY